MRSGLVQALCVPNRYKVEQDLNVVVPLNKERWVLSLPQILSRRQSHCPFGLAKRLASNEGEFIHFGGYAQAWAQTRLTGRYVKPRDEWLAGFDVSACGDFLRLSRFLAI